MHAISFSQACLALSFVSGLSLSSSAQTNIDFVGQLSYQDLRSSNLSNLWGYTDEEGNEYALMGVNGNDQGEPGGFSVVDLTDPTQPEEIFFLPGPASIWREIKVWENHAYITTEANGGGLTIVDLSPLPQSTDLPSTVYMDPEWETSHALFIDENGRLYIFGAGTGNGGAIMYDLTTDPMAPVQVGMYDPLYIHDGYARGDTLYSGHISNGFFSIVDVSDPSDPVLLGTQFTPNTFTHNVWLDDSGDHLYTTDERASAYVGAYNVNDPTDIQFLDKLQSDPGSGAVPHNTYWLPSQHVVQSYYTYGVTIYDVSRPDNMVEVGHYDTSPIEGGGFFGAWGVYPFFGSSRLIVSDIEEGLFILDPTYIRACWLEGNVLSSLGGPVGQATVSLLGTEAFDVTSIDGLYGTGYSASGTYSVEVSAPGYFPLQVDGIELINGEITLRDFVLTPLPSYPVEGIVRTEGTGEPIEGAQVVLSGEVYEFSTSTDASGAFVFPDVYDGTYTFDVGRWGWHTACPADLLIAGSGATGLVVELELGYADDMAMDLGWSISTTASRGGWVRGEPQGTTFEGDPSNPGADVEGDCRGVAFVTGNGGGAAGFDDLDEGSTSITSPVFDLEGVQEAHVRFQHWFFNGGGEGPPNDAMVFSVSNGVDTAVVSTLVAANGAMSQWVFNNIRIADFIPLTAEMRFMARIEDTDPGHLVEGGFDVFGIFPDATTSIPILSSENMSLWPNPTDGRFTLELDTPQGALVEVFDAVGRSVVPVQRTRSNRTLMDMRLASGTYVVRATQPNGKVLAKQLVVTE